jgi:hypothetical protein
MALVTSKNRKWWYLAGGIAIGHFWQKILGTVKGL